MPQLTINVPPELWSALGIQGNEQSDSHAGTFLRALSEYFENSRDRLYQVSTSSALVEGACEGTLEVGTLRKYGDLGIGTFEHLDGEMVVVDGRIFKVRCDGSVREVGDDVLTPFATVALFRPDAEVILKRCTDFASLTHAFDQLRATENTFFSLRVDGCFDYVRTRALCRMRPGTRLIEAATTQPEFEYRNVCGTMVGFWSPEYAKTLSIPGYHLHFLSEDRTVGGHLLECSGAELTLQLQRGTRFNLVLPETSSFLDADLRRDPTHDLEKAENFQPEKGEVTMSNVTIRTNAQVEEAAVTQSGAELLVKNLEAQGVKYVFGIPGAKIDKVFDRLVDSKIHTVLCRHEQNAAFIAAGIGRMTGKAGVCIGTSGPGCSNLVTGLATATSEGDPVVALGGATTVVNRLKRVHQAMDTVSIMKPVSKYSAEVNSTDAISEVVADAFRAAESGRPGAAFISLPMDIMAAAADGEVLTPVTLDRFGAADALFLDRAVAAINRAKNPVVLLGMLASQTETADAVRGFLKKTGLPVLNTYQAAGVVSQELFSQFGGRVGLFHNQPGDRLLDAADLVITVGYDPIEYDTVLWNKGKGNRVIHIDVIRPDSDKHYRPQVELIGNIAATLARLTERVNPIVQGGNLEILSEIAMERDVFARHASRMSGTPIHPMRLVHELQGLMSDDMTVCLDMGSFHIWLARYLYSFRARQVLITNGQQTMGVGLPWAIAASLVRPSEKVISISGDGGFMFSSMELETAVRLKCNLVHLVWMDGHYDMVRFQQIAKYGRDAAVGFGHIDVAGIADASGAHGMIIHHPEEIAPTLRKALDMQGPVVIGVPVDYRDNHKLMEIMRPGSFN